MRRLAGIIGIFILWELAARKLANPIFVPPSTVIPMWIQMLASGELWRHIAASLRTVTLGFAIAAAFGFLVAVLVTQFRTLDLAVTPVLDAMRPVAALTLFPLIILLLGLSIWSKVFVIFWTAWPAVVLNSAHGIRSIDPAVREAASLDGAGRWPILGYIAIPLAMPIILTGLRIGLSGGWISLVAAEMLGSSAGLGYAILSYSQTFQFAQMYAVILTIALLGLGMNMSLAILQSYASKESKDEEKYIRFVDRAASFSLDSFRLRWRNPNNGRAGS